MKIVEIKFLPISAERIELLQELIVYINQQLNKNKQVKLNFICTHNSRRSQFAHVWAQYFALKNSINLLSFSGGTEVSACDERTVAALKRVGFIITKQSNKLNPHYFVDFGVMKMELFSKLYDDESNPRGNFAAVMTCSHAEENCPFVLGADCRISLPYEDPKAFDGTEEEQAMYDLRNREIASEMNYVFSKIKTQ